MDIYILHLHSVVPGFTHLQTDLQCVEWDVKPYYTIPVLVSYVWHFMEGGGDNLLWRSQTVWSAFPQLQWHQDLDLWVYRPDWPVL